MKILHEFREFALKGNVADMAVGIIIGAAFGRIVTSLVNDILMPPLGLLIGGVDFTDLKILLRKETVDAAGNAIAAVTLNYGNFVQTAIDFTIVAAAVFAVIKLMNNLKRKKAEAAPAPVQDTKQELLLSEIRDILKSK
jgi:large conductance mechanosensitive channel